MTPDAPVKRCGLVIRVSTDNQAKNPEGSLKNQLQRLRAHIDYKNTACAENWLEGEQYILAAVSGKDSFRSKQFARLFDDIRTGKVNTILCTALDRVCRSVKDFLAFFEILAEHNVEFVCLKQNYDTTSPQGRLFITIMMALAEFEREQTSERNRDTCLARAERGLWNGGYLIGYDLPADKKGTLVPNEREVALVNFAFDTYLETGSILETARVLNERGYRTKEYQSRRDKFHPARKLSYTPVFWMLTNYAYIGKKEVNKKRRGEDQTKLAEPQRYRLVDANWPGILDPRKFYAVQELLAANSRTRTNQVKGVRHCYIFNHGLLWCEKCGTQMEGRSGTGRHGERHYYYICKTKGCGLRISAVEIERVVFERIKDLASSPDVLADLVAGTNARLQTELPAIEERKAALVKELDAIQATADGLMGKWEELDGTGAGTFVREKLEALGQRRKGLESGLAALEQTIDGIRREAVSEDLIRTALAEITDVFEELPPYQKKEMVRLVLSRAEVSEQRLRLAFHGRPPDAKSLENMKVSGRGGPRSETFNWLPGQRAQSAILVWQTPVRLRRRPWDRVLSRAAA